MLDLLLPADYNENQSEVFYPTCKLNPTFEKPRHVGSPNIGDRKKFLERVNDILDRKWFTNNGCYVQELEKQIEAYLQVKNCVLINNATIALDILGRALDLSGEVIVPSFTFIASAHSLLWQNLTPVFCDVDPLTHNLDPRAVEKLITTNTSAILGVHLWGRPCAINELTEIARAHNLKLFFDAAHAFGCSFGQQMIGNFGEAEVFSFHATKFFNTFEGGAIVTNNDLLAEKARLMRNFGFTKADSVVCLGTNGKMPEISAAMGLTNLESLEVFIKKNQTNYELYTSLLSKIPGLTVVHYDLANQNNFQYVVVEVDSKYAGFTRDELVEYMHSHNVLVRRYFYPCCHLMEPYKTRQTHLASLENSNELGNKIISFPNGLAVSHKDIYQIAQLVQDFRVKKVKNLP